MGLTDKFYKAMIFSGFFSLLSACGGSSSDDEDTNPDEFTFTAESDVPLATYVVSESVLIEGINAEATISIVGGEYSIDGADYTDEIGEVLVDQFVQVRILSEDTIDTESEATLTIGDQEATFTITTASAYLSAAGDFKSITFTWPSVDGADYYTLFEKASADGEFVSLGRELDATAVGLNVEIPIHRLDWFNAEYMLETCTVADCSYTDEISIYNYMRGAIGYIKATNTEAYDRFANVVMSADGETLAVGAPGEDSSTNDDDGNNESSGAGAVYVFVKDDGNWRFQAYIKAPNSDPGDAFGTALDVSSDGNTLVVGAPYEDSDASGIDGEQVNNNAEDSGAVYVFQRSGDTWLQQNYIKASDPDAGDNFGAHVSLSGLGATLAVGVPQEDSQSAMVGGDASDNGLQDSGAVYVYTLLSDNWQQQAYLKAVNPDIGDGFGQTMDLSATGNRLVVGAVNEQSASQNINGDTTDNSLVLAGAAYVYERSGDSWAYASYVKPSNTHENMQFAASLAISDDATTIVVGAMGEASNDIGIDGDQSNRANPDSGAVYVFTMANDEWTQDAYIKSSNGDVGDLFGSAIDVDATGGLIAVGAPGESGSAEGVSGSQTNNDMGDAGAVYVFEKVDNAWAQLKYVKSANTDAGDNFGRFVSLDASGDTLAVGAPDEQSDTTLFNNVQTDNSLTSAGAVYVY